MVGISPSTLNTEISNLVYNLNGEVSATGTVKIRGLRMQAVGEGVAPRATAQALIALCLTE
jgi:hypothetical protein